MGYSPQGHKESDTTERLTHTDTHTHTHTHWIQNESSYALIFLQLEIMNCEFAVSSFVVFPAVSWGRSFSHT